ncbi:putative ankyrin repeat protein RF_0381 [Cotesia glomerata]|uniref:Ankyrin repeat protein n=1 Tax=Cotesia glomerata TaxID=32391 RepID=A0AAV7HVC9_COTGL|nr:putative ankyrin repeat protein RF_0381 [Cotesia glomerata]KAH0535655.1 hypothetical protein KQX54_017964 [Cotesia glomerata]
MMVKKYSQGKNSKFGRYSKKKDRKYFFKKKNPKKRINPLVLQKAIECPWTNSISRFLQAGIDANSAPKLLAPLLYTAVRSSKYTMVQQLIAAGADPNFVPKLGDCGHPPKFLVPSPKIQCPCPPLIIAVDKGNEKMAKLLIQNKADPNIISCYGSALNIAVEKGIFKIVKLLLRAGADINGGLNECKPLHTAISKNNYIMVKYLIKWNADVNIVGKHIYEKELKLYTPLQMAILKENLKIVRLLTNNKAKIDRTILHYSLNTNNLDIISFCAINSVDVNAVNSYGESALHIACQKKSIEVINILLDAGANINIKDKRKKTALDFCFDYSGHILVALKQHIVRIKTAGMFISQDVMQQFNQAHPNNFSSPIYNDVNFDYDGLQRRCLSELEVMKNIIVKNTSISFFQILQLNQHQLALLLLDTVYEDAISEDNLRLKFPIYGGMIFYRLSRAFNEKKSLVIVNDKLGQMFNQELPELIKRNIYGYFNYGELTMLSKM